MSDPSVFTCKIHTLEQVIADSRPLHNIAAVYAINLGDTVLYVGKAQKVRRRLLMHTRQLLSGGHQNKKLQKVYDAANESFEFQILEVCSNLQQLSSKELKFHRFLRPTCFSATPHTRVENVKIRCSKDNLESLFWFCELSSDERGDLVSHFWQNLKDFELTLHPRSDAKNPLHDEAQ